MSSNYGLYNHPESKLLAFMGVLFLLTLAVISTLSLKIYTLNISAIWMPYIAVFLWPRWSDFWLSPVLIMLGGLLVDLINGQYLGLSSILFLVLYILLRPREREDRFSMWQALIEYIMFAGPILLAVMLISSALIGQAVSWKSLVLQFAFSAVIFPAVFYLRQFLRKIVIDPQDSLYKG